MSEGEPRRPPLEVGWVVAGTIERTDEEAVNRARREMLERLSHLFPSYLWRMPIVRRREIKEPAPVEPVAMLEHGARERDAMRLDFVFVVTDAELKSYYKPFALGVPSKAMNVALLSTARLERYSSGDEPEEAMVDALSRRIFVLALHLFGHMNDLPHSEHPDEIMYDLKTVSDLDGMLDFSKSNLAHLRKELAEEADVRLEESPRFSAKNVSIAFYARVVRKHALDIGQTVLHTRPWLFPFRLSRLTTAAVSAMLILIMTAEAWDLGMSQSPAIVVVLSVAALLGTVVYILKRQRLFMRRHERGLREQRVISNVSTVISIFSGMAVTYALLFASTLLVTSTFFNEHLVHTWAASLEGDIAIRHYLLLAAFVAALGIIIGALGASFEAHGYFRHITYVDEET